MLGERCEWSNEPIKWGKAKKSARSLARPLCANHKQRFTLPVHVSCRWHFCFLFKLFASLSILIVCLRLFVSLRVQVKSFIGLNQVNQFSLLDQFENFNDTCRPIFRHIVALLIPLQSTRPHYIHTHTLAHAQAKPRGGIHATQTRHIEQHPRLSFSSLFHSHSFICVCGRYLSFSLIYKRDGIIN